MVLAWRPLLGSSSTACGAWRVQELVLTLRRGLAFLPAYSTVGTPPWLRHFELSSQTTPATTMFWQQCGSSRAHCASARRQQHYPSEGDVFTARTSWVKKLVRQSMAPSTAAPADHLRVPRHRPHPSGLLPPVSIVNSCSWGWPITRRSGQDQIGVGSGEQQFRSDQISARVQPKSYSSSPTTRQSVVCVCPGRTPAAVATAAPSGGGHRRMWPLLGLANAGTYKTATRGQWLGAGAMHSATYDQASTKQSGLLLFPAKQAASC